MAADTGCSSVYRTFDTENFLINPKSVCISKENLPCKFCMSNHFLLVSYFISPQSLINVNFADGEVLKKMFRHIRALVVVYEKQEDVYALVVVYLTCSYCACMLRHRTKLICVCCECNLRPEETVYLPCPEHHTYCKPCIKEAWSKGERNCVKCLVHVPIQSKTDVPKSIR